MIRVILSNASRGTIHSVNSRNHLLGYIPYYIFLGCLPRSSINDFRGVPFVGARNQGTKLESEKSLAPFISSKTCLAAQESVLRKHPLPSSFYQRNVWRQYYDDREVKHHQFHDTYIYAFTWEDPKIDEQLLKIGKDDVILALTSAGDNILSYCLRQPKCIHAVDINPAQNHLLELKMAAFQVLGHNDIWKLFGQGRHEDFASLLTTKLSPYLSSQATQYWMANVSAFISNGGLYETGGTRFAIKIAKYFLNMFCVRRHIEMMCAAKTIEEQTTIWRQKVRPLILSKWLCAGIIANERFLWRALGVPQNQKDMIEADGSTFCGVNGQRAIWEYVVNTLDPVAETTLLGCDNYFYLLCLTGKYTKQ